MKQIHFYSAIFLILLFFSCTNKNPMQNNDPDQASPSANSAESDFINTLAEILSNAEIPAHISRKITGSIGENPAFLLELFTILQEDRYLWTLVDKERPLDENYEPDDLVALSGGGSYRVSRQDLRLRSIAEKSLEQMAAAAAAEGLTLIASSSYRSYDYQQQVYERNVREMGQEAADRESARPGRSQHQLGLVVDFGSITDDFARTAEGRWISANASRFGWSLSFPDGYEGITGYRWESWHYRYVGEDLARFIDIYFDGIQQYALRFIHEYVKAVKN